MSAPSKICRVLVVDGVLVREDGQEWPAERIVREFPNEQGVVESWLLDGVPAANAQAEA